MACNIFFVISTSYFLISKKHDGLVSPITKTQNLPESLQTNKQRMVLFDSIVNFYNNKDIAGLYNLFDDMLKVKYDLEEFKTIVQKMYDLSGTINKGAFTHYEWGKNEYFREFTLCYLIKTNQGEMKLRVIIRQQGEEKYRILGFKINS